MATQNRSTAIPPAPSDAKLDADPTAQPGGGAETASQVRAKAVDVAEVREDTAKLAADAAGELAKLAELPMRPLNEPAQDALGRPLVGELDERRQQQRAAVAIRQQRVEIDVARVQRGLAPKYATE